MDKLQIDYSSYYFSVVPFIKAARELNCWCLLIVGARDRGKTYSMLEYAYDQKEQLIFCKRQVSDIDLLCSAAKKAKKKIKADDEDEYYLDDEDDDLSPYADLNEDKHINVQPKKIYEGVASFHDRDSEDRSVFKCGYAFAIASVAKYKGFGGLRKCDYLVFDEFIPAPWERKISKLEGEAVLDLYATASRDREQRGKRPLLFVGLANANDLSNQLFNALEITDEVADMVNNHEEIRKIGGKLIVLVDDSKLQVAKDEKKTLIYQDLKDTTWGRVTYSNQFARNDLSCIGHTSIKGMKCRCEVIYKSESWFIYQKEQMFYVCSSRSNKCDLVYDLDFEAPRKPFYLKEAVAIINAYHKGNVKFQKFRMYDVIIHFKKFFDI